MPIATQIRQIIVIGVYIRKDVGATSSTCPTVKVSHYLPVWTSNAKHPRRI